MPAAVLPFPITALPGRRPGEGQGDLINCFARKVGNLVRWQRVPGTRRFTPGNGERTLVAVPPLPALGEPRGQLVVGQYLLSVWGDKVVRTLEDGTEEVMAGVPLPGTEPVTMAHNLATPIDVVAVADGNAYWLDMVDGPTGTIKPYPEQTIGDPPVPTGVFLGAVTSVDYYSGYFVFSRPNNEFVATNLQTLNWDSLSFAKAEAAGDTLVRVFAAPPVLYVCGFDTIEVWQDVGTAPFPFQRVTVIPVGLIGPWAIAGGARDWDRSCLFVAHDHTVRMLKNYDPVIVSNEDVAADIEGEARLGAASELVAQVYTHGDNAIWSLASPIWTWEYNLSTGAWHRRRSYQPADYNPEAPEPWRARFAAHFDQRYYAQDDLDGGLLEITSEAMNEPSLTRLSTTDGTTVTEYAAPLIARCESGPVKENPANIRLPVVYLDFSSGFDVDGVPDPEVLLSWSHDGGATWSNPVSRRIGGTGEFRALVALRNIGRSSHHGVRVRWECVDPVPVVFQGALAPTARPSRPRQVAVTVTGIPGG